MNGGRIGIRWNRFDKLIPEALVVSLSQIMETIFAESAFQRIPAKQDHAVQAFLFDGTYEALRVRIAVRRFWRNWDDVHIVFLQNFSKLSCLFRISVDDEVRVASEKAFVGTPRGRARLVS